MRGSIFIPEESQIKTLQAELSEMLGIDLPDDIIEDLRILIIHVRRYYFNKRRVLNRADDHFELKQKIKSLKNTLHKLSKLARDDELMACVDYPDLSLDDLAKSAPLHERLDNFVSEFLEYIEFNEGIRDYGVESVKGHQIRDILARELARTLDRIGITPTKTRNGPYDLCLLKVVDLCTFKHEGITYFCPLPEDTFPVLKKGVDEYKKIPEWEWITSSRKYRGKKCPF